MFPLKNLLYKVLIAFNITIVLAMLATGYAYVFKPETHPYLAISYLFFPIFLAANLIFMIIWAFVKLRYALIPSIGFVLCYQPTRLYMPLNAPKSVPKTAIKVLSYNTEIFGFLSSNGNKETRDSIVSYIVNANADIVCLQESQNWFQDPAIDSTLSNIYRYKFEEYSHLKDNRVWILSRYPLKQKQRIKYASNFNLSIAAQVETPQGTILLVNNHLETNNLSPEDKSEFKRMLTGKMSKNDARKEGLFLFKKLSWAQKKRAKQVEAVQEYLMKHQKMPLIICGDFNEGPNGYAVNIFRKHLKSAFVESGNFMGWSYNRSGMYVRIDHILHSKHFTAYQTKVDNCINKSDHYPIISTLVFN